MTGELTVGTEAGLSEKQTPFLPVGLSCTADGNGSAVRRAMPWSVGRSLRMSGVSGTLALLLPALLALLLPMGVLGGERGSGSVSGSLSAGGGAAAMEWLELALLLGSCGSVTASGSDFSFVSDADSSG